MRVRDMVSQLAATLLVIAMCVVVGFCLQFLYVLWAASRMAQWESGTDLDLSYEAQDYTTLSTPPRPR